ncbi:MAG: hypothetical protein Q9169_004832 [Polycauliona sp. 2 TL-2023]
MSRSSLAYALSPLCTLASGIPPSVHTGQRCTQAWVFQLLSLSFTLGQPHKSAYRLVLRCLQESSFHESLNRAFVDPKSYHFPGYCWRPIQGLSLRTSPLVLAPVLLTALL